jgi:hypothetical protein
MSKSKSRPLAHPLFRGKCFCWGAALALAVSAHSACTRTKFRGDSKETPPKKDPQVSDPVPKGTTTGGTQVISPTEIDIGKPQNPTTECGNKHRGLRMALIIDTSLSMGDPNCRLVVSPNSNVLLQGSDQPRTGNSIRGKTECFTDRQNAAWHIVTRTALRDKAAEAQNPNFMGSEVGIAQFPEAGVPDSYKKLSGQPPLRNAMTNLGGITADEPFKNDLWTLLQNTYTPTGVTPYRAALAAGRDLLKTGRDPNDPRKDIVFLVTDGIPTDMRPSTVIATREELKDVYLIYLYMFDPNVAEAARQQKAKLDMQEAFDKNGYGRTQGNSDAYGPQDFERYWQDLLALPGKIANARIDVSEPSLLAQKVDEVLDSLQKCE